MNFWAVSLRLHPVLKGKVNFKVFILVIQHSEIQKGYSEEQMLAFVISLLVNPKISGFLELVAEVLHPA